MPGLVRKLVIIAAVDGLVLQSLSQRNQRTPSAIKIDYKTHQIISLEEGGKDGSTPSASLEAHGIVGKETEFDLPAIGFLTVACNLGLLTVSSTSFLITISRRQQVAQIRGKPIYVVTSVAFIPLSSQTDAENAVAQTKESLKKQSEDGKVGDSDSSDDEDDHSINVHDDSHEDDNLTHPTTPEPAIDSRPDTPKAAHKRSTSIAEDVIGRKGQYGRFADRWFSKKGWSVEKRRMQGMSADDVTKSRPIHDSGEDGGPAPVPDVNAYNTIYSHEDPSGLLLKGQKPNTASSTSADDVTNSLLPKLLKTTKMMLSSRSFFFSYDCDITRRIGHQDGRSSDIPLHKKVDHLVCHETVFRKQEADVEQFFWNRHITRPFIDGGLHSFVLPLMQGFVGQRTFSINAPSTQPEHNDAGDIIKLQNIEAKPEEQTTSSDKRDFLLTLISRRSIKRPGLRYLRRGIDDEGDTANSVETEQILSSSSWQPTDKIHSFVQYRGSIPLYFSQSPYSFKPAPVLQHSPATNHAAFKRHCTNIIGRYGGIQIVLLVDKHGVEAKIGEEYQKHVEQLNEEGAITGTKLDFEWFDFHAVCRGMKFENVSLLMETLGSKLDEFGKTVEVDGQVQKKQSGVLRTNCMDCLDRTNVVQSACGQRALEQQLKEDGINISLQTDKTTEWFNTLWADNGDAISKQYSSTAALKGDYTRTRKRDYRGAINDFGLTLSRYFNNIFNDYFSQAAIDYLLGNVTSQVFEEFEADMMSGDPTMSMRKVRQNAIDTSFKIVIADQSEELIGGWTLLSPHNQNSVRTFPFEEAVLLLTDAALYAVRFDWNMEKVSSFERVDLRSVLGLQYGTYITSTLAASQTDEKRNVGFVVRYRPGKEDVVRVNTRSLNNALGEKDGDKLSADDNHAVATATGGSASPAAPNVDLQGPSETSPKRNISTTTSAPTKILAFKALPARSSLAHLSDGHESPPVVSETELIKSICEEIERACLAGDVLNHDNNENHNDGQGKGEKGKAGMIEEKDIIPLTDAKKSTGLLEVWGHELKKLVWA